MLKLRPYGLISVLNSAIRLNRKRFREKANNREVSG